MATAKDVLKIAEAYADKRYREGKNNDSIFGKWYGLNYQPWCAMFVSYCFNKAGLGSKVAISSKKGFASCSAAVSYFRKNKKLVPTKKAQAGDIVFFNFHGGTSPDHVGIVIDNHPKHKILHTVEGNTVNPNGTGSQVNGDGVYYKTRPYAYVVAVAHVI